MSTMDDIIRKTKEIGAAAAKKTGEAVEQTKIKLSISETRSQIKEKQAIIGEACYNAQKNNTDMDCADIISELDTLYAKLSELEEKLAEVKSTKKCPQCGNNSPKTAAYCQKCGYKFE